VQAVGRAHIYRLSQHSLDIVFKLEAEQLGTALGRRFGLSLPPIVRHFPTELPVVDVHLEQLDTVFELADSSLLHLEFQTVHRRETLLRFLQYDVGLYAQYQRSIHTMVIYGAGISSAPETLNFGVVQYDVRNGFLGRDDGEETYQRLRARVESGLELEPEERLDLVFLPLMRHTRPSVEVVSGALALARQLAEEQQRQTLAALIGLGQRFLEQHELDALLEGLMATNLGQQLLDRGWAAAKRDDVLKVLTKRFDTVSPALGEQLQQVNDVERLDALLDAALAAQSLDEFVQTLNNSLTS